MCNSKFHLSQLYNLLKKEYEYEKEMFHLDSIEMPIRQKIRRGICWAPITISKFYYNSLNQYVVEIHRTEDTDIEHHFEFGQPVLFFTKSDDKKSNDLTPNKKNVLKFIGVEGTVNYASSQRMVIAVNNPSVITKLEKPSFLGIQLGFNEQDYKAMFAALEEVQTTKNKHLILLREIIHGQVTPSFNYAINVSIPWINNSQQKAINTILRAQDIAIVHGPPGTGKTTTLVEAIYEVLHRESQVLVCAQSNMAIDWIAEKLIDRGVPILRIGNPSRITKKIQQYTYESQFQNHNKYSDLWSLRKEIRQIQQRRKTDYTSREKDRNQIRKLREKADEIQMEIHTALFSQARVVASTLSGSNHKLMFNQHFSTLFIDEAAQATTPMTWVAMRKARKVILAGDHCQLPPVIKSSDAIKGGLSKSLMEVIANKHPHCVELLTLQYRMNEEIMQFSSDWFYNGLLKAAASVQHRNILDLDKPIEWIDTSYLNPTETIKEDSNFQEEFIGNCFGRINRGEAYLLLEYLQRYINRIGRQRILDENIDFGIISPYMNQVQLMQQLIQKNDALIPLKNRITIHTVDGFQGQERDVIFISLVRANSNGDIGFLKDLRRMNVAMTRARMKLVIIGNVKTLSKHRFYKELIEKCK
ncbi:MAG TPA: AAA domain-containing protein [Bacteroidaceae bacterium]|nr:AAA domain-containing protein [Bacteroidaceae bacterium]